VIIGVAGWRGVGVTTTAVAAATGIAARGSRPWLVEADPAGSVLAARLGSGAQHVGGLERVAFPTTKGTIADRLGEVALVSGGVRVVLAPGDPFRAAACHQPRVPWASALHDLAAPVVIDLGTLRPGSPQLPILSLLDVLLLVANPDTVSIVSTLDWAAARGRVGPGGDVLPLDITRVVVVDAPVVCERVSRLDAQTELGDRFAGWLPWSPIGVAQLHRGVGSTDRRLRRDPFVQASHHLAERLADWVDMGLTA